MSIRPKKGLVNSLPANRRGKCVPLFGLILWTCSSRFESVIVYIDYDRWKIIPRLQLNKSALIWISDCLNWIRVNLLWHLIKCEYYSPRNVKLSKKISNSKRATISEMNRRVHWGMVVSTSKRKHTTALKSTISLQFYYNQYDGVSVKPRQNPFSTFAQILRSQ